MSISREIVIGAFLYIAISQLPAQTTSNCPSTEDLQDEYYTVTPAMTDQFVPKDCTYAEAIYVSNKSPATIAGILPYREKIRRYAINVIIGIGSGVDPPPHWFTPKYKTLQNPFEDCCFALSEKESAVLSNYLINYMTSKDKQRIGIVIVLTKDRKDVMNLFAAQCQYSCPKFDELQDPYKSLVLKWTNTTRDPLETVELNQDSVIKDANALNTEHNNGGWKTTRSQLESIFLQKSIKYARAVITEFEKLNNGKTIEDTICGYGLDNDLASTYRSLAQYIKYKYTYIAEILLKYSDGLDKWDIWNMCMAVIHPQEWSKVDEAFKKINKGVSLTKFIMERKIDKVLAEMMAAVIDPSFVPTKFKPLKD